VRLGTAAVHTAVAALDPEPGDEIITSPITDMGALAPILYQGAIPVFADVDPRRQRHGRDHRDSLEPAHSGDHGDASVRESLRHGRDPALAHARDIAVIEDWRAGVGLVRRPPLGRLAPSHPSACSRAST